MANLFIGISIGIALSLTVAVLFVWYFKLPKLEEGAEDEQYSKSSY